MTDCPACGTDLAVLVDDCERHGWWRNYVMALQLLWGCAMDIGTGPNAGDEFYTCQTTAGRLIDLLPEKPYWLLERPESETNE